MRVRILGKTELKAVSDDSYAGKFDVSAMISGAVIRDGKCYFKVATREVYVPESRVVHSAYETVPEQQKLWLFTEVVDEAGGDNTDEMRYGYAIIRASGINESKVVFAVWYDSRFGENSSLKARYDVAELDPNGPSNVIWEAGLR